MSNVKYTLLEHILNEGRLEDAIKKYVDKLPEPIVRELSAADPSGNNKYLDWMTRTVIQAPRDKADIIAKIKCFHENVNRLSDNHVKAIYGEEKWVKPNAEAKAVLEDIRKKPKDINAYPSHLWIKPMCEYFEEQKPKNTSRVKLFEDEKWLLVAPLTHQASCSYGAHSNWCVSTTNSSYFGQYMNNGILIFFMDKKGYNPKKKDANIYKFAVHIQYDRPNYEDWGWYSMEDQQIDARLMMNLVPQQLLEIAKKYLEDVLKELGKHTSVDEKELTEKSDFWYRQGSYYFVFPKFENWDPSSMTKVTEYLKKYHNNVAFDLSRYRESGLPYFNIQTSANRLPTIREAALNWNLILNLRDNQTNNVSKSALVNAIITPDRWGGLRNITDHLTPEDKVKLINLYIKMFNEAKITRNTKVRTTELQVGDQIIYRPHGRTWGNGVPLTVARVAEKSLQLSNGQRIARTVTSIKEKVLSTTQVVDDTVKTESRWIRKRII